MRLRSAVRTSFQAVGLCTLVAACGPAAPAEVAPCPTGSPSASAAPTQTPTAAPSSSASAYAGHGAGSVSPELLAKYAPPRLPAEVSRRIQGFLDVRAPGAGILSPDGKQLFFTWTITGIRQIWRIDGPQKFPSQLTGGEDPTWVADITADGKTLIVQRDRKGEEYPGLYLLNPNGGALTVISHKEKVQTQFLFTTADSKWVYFRTNEKKADSYAIYRYNLESKATETVFEQDGIWAVADHVGTEKLLLIKEVGSNMEEYFEYNVAQKALTPLFGQGERENYQAAYSAKEGEILVLTPKLSEYRRLYSFSVKDKKFTAISPDIKHDVSDFSIDDAKTKVFYGTNENGYSRLHVLDAKTLKEVKLPKLPSGDHIVHARTTRDGSRSVIQIDPGNSPPQSYVITWKGDKVEKWHSPSAPEMDTSTFAKAELMYYPARDGTQIPMFVRSPRGCGSCPVLVMFHGGPEAQATPGFSPRGQIFVDAGFVLVEPNVRGSDGYGKTWLHADDAAKRLNIITDIEDAGKFVRKNWTVNGKVPKVGVLGGSYGGYSTLIAMTMFAGTYDAGSSVVGISNLYTFLMNTAPYRRILRISEYGDPEKEKDMLLKLSPTTYVDKVNAPLQIIQGATDPRVPVGEAVQFKEALDGKKIPAELIVFADEGHGAQKRENQVLQYGHMVRFFQEHLMGKK
ncbi:MAG: S9 family peptidase [Polyangiaceae bacterium]|nr:S9 family peptidase [Polyangiaceae bacterium]